MKPIRLLIADDHLLFRAGLVSLFSAHQDFEVVAEANDGAQAAAQTAQTTPDIVLMDVRMPGMSGIEALQRIKAAAPEQRVIMLTASEDDRDLFEAIKAGANGYLLKNTDPDELFAYVRGSMLGEAAISGRLAARILGEMSRSSARATADDLSEREIEVLRMVADGASNKAIASRLNITENTVKKHLQSILDKLHLQNRTQAAAYALRTGIVSSTGSSDH
jgi:DNA-binding NarL/FixJ family response regulator